MYLLRGAR